MTAAAPFDLTGWIGHYGMVLLRVLGLFVFLPIFSSELIPIRIRFGIAAVLALALLPLVPRPAEPATDVLAWAVVGLRELSVGFGLGIAARAVFAGIEGAAGLVAGQSGFALASMIDPVSGDQAVAPALFQNLLAITLFLAADLHHVFLRAVVTSYELLPPSSGLPHFGSLGGAADLLGVRLFTVAIELAAPALVVTISIDLVLGLVGRAMPQVPILFVGYPFKLAGGLVAMVILAVTTGSTLGWIGRTLASDGAAVLAALGGK